MTRKAALTGIALLALMAGMAGCSGDEASCAPELSVAECQDYQDWNQGAYEREPPFPR